uniref:acid sphingomyelinase-like phosphodiesterase 3b n=1 Tax=Myxine glutinosa TaxID=7769 RepID=UPI00358E2001
MKRLLPLLIVCFLVHGVEVKSGRFWHITDQHWDPDYNESATPDHVCPSSSIPVPSAGFWGDYLCDSPWVLINSSLQAMKNILPDPDFIIWTGDDTPHISDDDTTEDTVLMIIQNITELISSTFPGVQVYPALGNHDYYPSNQLPPKNGHIYNVVAKMWSEWLQNSSQQTFQKGGYYTEIIKGQSGHRIVSLNTNLYYNNNNQTGDLEDPAKQFEWLEKVLKDASAANEKVYIIGHIPPGFFEKLRNQYWFRSHFNKHYIDVIQKHHKVISGQFFGHHHSDSFRIFFNSDTAISTMFIAPAITPWKNTLPGVNNGSNNPGIRIFEYNITTLELQDMVTYYFNLSAANLNSPKWAEEYRFTTSYGVPDITLSSITSAVKSFRTNQSLFQTYYNYNSVSYDLETCNEMCQMDHYCAITQLSHEGYAVCVNGATRPYSKGIL